MTELAPARRAQRRSDRLRETPAAASAPGRGDADTVLIQLDELRAELACGAHAGADGNLSPYEQGFAAYAAGMGLGDNPYPEDSCAHMHWANGWSQARDEAQRQAR